MVVTAATEVDIAIDFLTEWSGQLSRKRHSAETLRGIGTNTQRTSAPNRGNMSDKDSTVLKELVLF